jgi:hypothetical protein
MTPSIAEIATMDRAALVAAWSDLFQTPVPPHLSQAFLRRFLAFELQARQFGGLPKALEAKLTQAVQAKDVRASAKLKPGGRLLREWNGVTHVVEVFADSFRWNGRNYRSLSAIARAITGARWSGLRFFGLSGSSR